MGKKQPQTLFSEISSFKYNLYCHNEIKYALKMHSKISNMFEYKKSLQIKKDG